MNNWKSYLIYLLPISFILFFIYNYKKTFYKTLAHTFFWFFGNTIFGLLPILFGYYLSILDPIVSFSISEIFKQIIVPFYCISLSASAMIDFIFSNIDKNSKITYIYYTFPLLICALTIPLYQQFLLKKAIDDETIFNLHIVILLFSLIYCIITKYKLFLIDLQKE